MTKVLYFSAPWCQPCQTFGPIVNEVAEQFPDVMIEKLNIDEVEDQLRGLEHGVMSIPTLVSGDKRLVGAVEPQKLQAWLGALVETPMQVAS